MTNTEENTWNPSEMLEVILNKPDDFLIVKETLARIGVSSKAEAYTLFQSCHILHKRGKYFIVHFKELFLLDGKAANFSEDDRQRRDTIANLLDDWGLLNIVDGSKHPKGTMHNIKVVPARDKKNWTFKPKYQIGKG